MQLASLDFEALFSQNIFLHLKEHSVPQNSLGNNDLEWSVKEEI